MCSLGTAAACAQIRPWFGGRRVNVHVICLTLDMQSWATERNPPEISQMTWLVVANNLPLPTFFCWSLQIFIQRQCFIWLSMWPSASGQWKKLIWFSVHCHVTPRIQTCVASKDHQVHEGLGLAQQWHHPSASMPGLVLRRFTWTEHVWCCLPTQSQVATKAPWIVSPNQCTQPLIAAFCCCMKVFTAENPMLT